MKLIVQGVAGIVLFGLCTVQGPTPAGGGANGLFYLRAIPSSAVHHLQAPHMHLREGTSLNWSGYAIETSLSKPASNAVSDVAGGWVVPAAVASTSKYTYSSAWVGIDGYSSDSVEQIGTEQDWTPRGAEYYAWFEMYPNWGYEIVNFPVHPGDTITAMVAYTGSKTVTVNEGRGRKTTEVFENFKLTITNLTHAASYTTTQQIQSPSRSSAEWIMEAPSESSVLPLADFRTVSFFGCDATVNGVTGPIGDAAWRNDTLTMETSAGVAKAVPSALTSGGSAFAVTWKHE
jgi:hypothetical protein